MRLQEGHSAQSAVSLPKGSSDKLPEELEELLEAWQYAALHFPSRRAWLFTSLGGGFQSSVADGGKGGGVPLQVVFPSRRCSPPGDVPLQVMFPSRRTWLSGQCVHSPSHMPGSTRHCPPQGQGGEQGVLRPRCPALDSTVEPRLGV